MEHEFIYGRKMPIEMLVRQVADSKDTKRVVTPRGALLYFNLSASSLRSGSSDCRSGCREKRRRRC